MKRVIYLFLILLLAACGNSKTASLSSDSTTNSTANASAQSTPLKVTAQSILANMEKGRYAAGELLVKFKPGVIKAQSLKTHQSLGASVVRKFSVVPNLQHVKLPAGLSVKDAIVQYMSDPNVDYAEPNYIRRISSTVPNDIYFNQQWALQNTGQFAGGTAGADIKAPQAWDITTGDPTIVIAVLDTGIALSHHDLANNIWANPGETNCVNGIDNDGNGFINDCHGWDFTTCANFDLTSTISTATAALDGAHVVPPVTTQAKGTAALTVDFSTGEISGTVSFSGLGTNATFVSIREGVVGTNGLLPIVSSAVPPGTSGIWTVPDGTFLTTNQLTELSNNGLYVDVRSIGNPAGEIRGQIIPTGILACITPKEQSNDPSDDVGHGTHVAGIIGAVGNNGIGTAGVMWNVKLLPLKIFNSQEISQVADELAAIQYVSDNITRAGWNIKAINASFGSSAFSASERDAIDQVGTRGVLFVAAAGNSFNNNDQMPSFPASYSNPVYGGLSNVISVAATDQQDRLASFSGFGLNSVHVAAPGVYILSTVPPGLSFSLCTGSEAAGYDFCSGTSMAAPHVTGLVGLLSSVYTNYNASQVRGTILRYVDVLPSLQNMIQREGRINAFSAVSSLLGPTNLTATPLSTSEISLSWTDNATGEDGYRVLRCIGPQCTNFVDITKGAPLPPNTTTLTDSQLNLSTQYTYQVQAFNFLPNPPSSALIEADSFFSNQASATTPATNPLPPAPSGGGGGCSIGARQNAPTAVADFAILLMPLLFIMIVRRRR